MKKKLIKIFLVIIGITVYLDTGWALGTFYVSNVMGGVSCEKSSSVLICKAASGGWNFLNSGDPTPKDNFRIAAFSVLWPLFITLSVASWAAYGLCQLLWFIFAGGVVKLIGLV